MSIPSFLWSFLQKSANNGAPVDQPPIDSTISNPAIQQTQNTPGPLEVAPHETIANESKPQTSPLQEQQTGKSDTSFAIPAAQSSDYLSSLGINPNKTVSSPYSMLQAQAYQKQSELSDRQKTDEDTARKQLADINSQGVVPNKMAAVTAFLLPLLMGGAVGMPGIGLAMGAGGLAENISDQQKFLLTQRNALQDRIDKSTTAEVGTAQNLYGNALSGAQEDINVNKYFQNLYADPQNRKQVIAVNGKLMGAMQNPNYWRDVTAKDMGGNEDSVNSADISRQGMHEKADRLMALLKQNGNQAPIGKIAQEMSDLSQGIRYDLKNIQQGTGGRLSEEIMNRLDKDMPEPASWSRWANSGLLNSMVTESVPRAIKDALNEADSKVSIMQNQYGIMPRSEVDIRAFAEKLGLPPPNTDGTINIQDPTSPTGFSRMTPNELRGFLAAHPELTQTAEQRPSTQIPSAALYPNLKKPRK